MVAGKLAGLSKDALLYGIGDALGRLIGLILLPVLTRVFGPSDYGRLDILSISYVFLLFVAQLNIPSGVQRFYYRNEARGRQEMVSSSYVFMAFAALGVAGLIALLSGWIASQFGDHSHAMQASVLLLAAALPVEATWSYFLLLLRLRRKPVAFSVANAARVVLTPGLTVLLVVLMEQGIVGVFRAKFVSLTLLTIGLFPFVRGDFNRRVRFRTFQEVCAFSLPGHPAILLRQVLVLAPRYLLAYFAPLSAVGLFGIAMRISNVMKIYVAAFNRAWNPFAYQNEGTRDERAIYELAFKGFSASLLVLVMMLSLFSSNLLRLLTTPEYHGAALLVPGIALHFAMDGPARIFSTALYTRGRVQTTSYLAMLRMGVFLLSGIVLTPRFGAAGMVASLALASIVFGVAYGVIAYRTLPFPIPVARLCVLTVVAVGIPVTIATYELGPIESVPVKLLLILGMVFSLAVSLFSAQQRRRGVEQLRLVLRREQASDA